MPAAPVFAGAWTLDARSAHVFLTTLHYRASDVFDRQGDTVRLGNDGEFRKWEFNPYIEYGLTDDVTLVANLFLRHVEFEDRFRRDENFGFADPELGVRYQLTPRVVLDAGVGSELAGPADRSPFFVTVGISFGF